ncbi:MAG TPA: chalcone isomerase family protein [Candidatus Kapabacteria bacterium]|nr:chalcone isomerase family protein [Candidatus Kapabacteria bacterium]
MRTLLSLLLALILFTPLAAPAKARQIGGIDLADSIQVGKQQLVLNGAGVRNKFFMDVYVAGLYLSHASHDAATIVAADEVQSVRLVITSSQITRQRLLEAIDEGIHKSAGKDYPRYQPRMQELWDAITFEVKPGDIFAFTYIPGEGTHVSMNGKELRVLPEFDFKKVLFGIWLGPDPIQASLKRDMLDE